MGDYKGDTRFTLALHQKVYDNFVHVHRTCSKMPSEYRYTLTPNIINTATNMITEIIKFEESQGKSHLYNLSTDTKLLLDHITCCRDLKITAFGNKTVRTFSKRIDEILRMNNALINSEKAKAYRLAKKEKKKKEEANKVVSLNSFVINKSKAI